MGFEIDNITKTMLELYKQSLGIEVEEWQIKIKKEMKSYKAFWPI